MKKITTLLLLICSLSIIYAQKNTEAEKLLVFAAHFQFGTYLPAGDLANRFGFDNAPQLTLDFLTKKDWIFGAEGHYIFGKNVREDPLSKLRTPEGYLIGNNRLLADVQLKERGSFLGCFVGKLFPLGGGGRANGLRVTLGAGWLQHKIRIQDDSQTAAQLVGNYLKGYDRLSGGIAATQFVGYQLFTKSKNINFFTGFSAQEGFTKSLRDFDFEKKSADTARRLDVRLGLVVGFALPFYLGSKGEDVYY